MSKLQITKKNIQGLLIIIFLTLPIHTSIITIYHRIIDNVKHNFKIPYCNNAHKNNDCVMTMLMKKITKMQ